MKIFVLIFPPIKGYGDAKDEIKLVKGENSSLALSISLKSSMEENIMMTILVCNLT